MKALLFPAFILFLSAGTACSFSTDECDNIDPVSLCAEPSGPECSFNGSVWYIRECSGPYDCLHWQTIENCGYLKKCEEDYYSPPRCVCDTAPPSCLYEYLDHGLRDFSTCLTPQLLGRCSMTTYDCPVWERTECNSTAGCVEDEHGAQCPPDGECRGECPEFTFGKCSEVGKKTCDFSDEKKTILICNSEPTLDNCGCWGLFLDCGTMSCQWTWSAEEERYVPYCG